MFKFFIAVVVATTPMAARAQDTGVAQQVLSDTGASYPTSFSGPSKQEEPVGTLVDLRSTRASRAVLPESLVPGVRPDGTLRGLPGGFSVVVDDVTSSIPIRFHLTSFEASNLGGWTIAGRTTESPTDVFVMSRFEDSVSGYIEARHGAWEFEGSAGREGIALRRVEGDAGDACESRVDEAESKGSLDLGFGLHECSLDAGEDVDWVSIESFGVSMMSALGGPWQGFDGVLDLMFVYDPSILGSAPGFPTTASGLNANIMTAVANVQAAFAASGINWGVRIVSIKSTPWSYASGLSPQREQLRLTSDGHVDSVHAWRNDAGADIVVGIVPEDGGGAHGNSSVPLDHLASNESTAFLVVEADALLGLNSLAHELGHQAGNGHEHISGCGADLNIADYAMRDRFRHSSPTELRRTPALVG